MTQYASLEGQRLFEPEYNNLQLQGPQLQTLRTAPALAGHDRGADSGAVPLQRRQQRPGAQVPHHAQRVAAGGDRFTAICCNGCAGHEAAVAAQHLQRAGSSNLGDVQPRVLMMAAVPLILMSNGYKTDCTPN